MSRNAVIPERSLQAGPPRRRRGSAAARARRGARGKTARAGPLHGPHRPKPALYAPRNTTQGAELPKTAFFGTENAKFIGKFSEIQQIASVYRSFHEIA